MAKVIKQRKEVVDMETGEIYEVIMILPEAKDKDFVKVYRAYSQAVLNKLDRLKGAIYVLVWIMDRLKFDTDTVYINPKTVAKSLNKSVRQVYNYLKVLESEGFLFKVPNEKYVYKLNTSYFYKGRVKKMEDDFRKDYVQVLQ